MTECGLLMSKCSYKTQLSPSFLSERDAEIQQNIHTTQ